MAKKNILLDWIILAVLIALLALHYTKLIAGGLDNRLLFVVSLIVTMPVVFSALRSLKNREVSVDLLASIALIASLITKQWDSAAFINLMLTSARLFGSYTESKARAAIESLLKLRPQKVKVKRGEEITEVPVEAVKVGDLVVVETGDRIAIDGIIIDGTASINQSSLTGESLPVFKKKGDKVFSSTLNVSGYVVVKTEKIGKDTTLEKLIALVESSQKNKSNIRTTADKFATWYIVIALGSSLAIYIISHDLMLVLSLLLVACADDIAVAIPMGFLAAIGYAAKRGVIIKGGNFLEALSNVKTIIVDKTGTLTKGKLKVHKIISFNEYTKEDVIKLGAMAESLSEHPVAKAINEYAKEQKINLAAICDFEEFPGHGTKSTCENKQLVSGKLSFLKESKVKILKEDEIKIEQIKDEGFSVTLVGYNGKLVGAIAAADVIRPNMKKSIERLRALGVENFVMLTGDNEKVADRVGKEVGITTYHANLLPEDKLAYIKQYLNKETKTIMVGDGVNDAAGLALSDIGVAMGAIGSDAAIEAADIALMKDDFSEIPEMVELSRYTNRVANQDFWIWGIVNTIGLTLVFSRILGPNGSAAFNFVTDFLPIINSIRLFNLHLKLK